MSDLTNVEKRSIEKLLGMGSGYVLDFSNRTFEEFVRDSVGKSIYAAEYETGGGSKANRLRALMSKESNHLVGKLLSDLLEYADERQVSADEKPLLEACRRTVQRLTVNQPVPEIDAITPNSGEKVFVVLAKSVRESIEKNEPETGLDRLHTFVVKYMRVLCEKRGITIDRDKPLHSLVGEYIKRLKEAGDIESEMTERILKSSISILEAFNRVRNEQSFAHDNPILNYDESLLIFNHVTSAIKFISGLERRKAVPAKREESGVAAEGEISF